MLDSDDGALLSLADAVGELPCDIELPPSWNDFLDHAESRPIRAASTEKRRHARWHLRTWAGLLYRQTAPVLRRPMTWHRVQVTDLSRSGIHFLHSEQLFPLERMRLVVPDPRVREFVPDPEDCVIEIVRCRRIQHHCFEIGARFVEGL